MDPLYEKVLVTPKEAQQIKDGQTNVIGIQFFQILFTVLRITITIYLIIIGNTSDMYFRIFTGMWIFSQFFILAFQIARVVKVLKLSGYFQMKKVLIELNQKLKEQLGQEQQNNNNTESIKNDLQQQQQQNQIEQQQQDTENPQQQQIKKKQQYKVKTWKLNQAFLVQKNIKGLFQYIYNYVRIMQDNSLVSNIALTSIWDVFSIVTSFYFLLGIYLFWDQKQSLIIPEHLQNTFFHKNLNLILILTFGAQFLFTLMVICYMVFFIISGFLYFLCLIPQIRTYNLRQKSKNDWQLHTFSTSTRSSRASTMDEADKNSENKQNIQKSSTNSSSNNNCKVYPTNMDFLQEQQQQENISQILDSPQDPQKMKSDSNLQQCIIQNNNNKTDNIKKQGEEKQTEVKIEYQCTECAICLEDYSEGEQIVQLSCHEQHKFHSSCLKDWLKSKDTCPLCKKQFPNFRLGQLSNIKNKSCTNSDFFQVFFKLQLSYLPEYDSFFKHCFFNIFYIVQAYL